MASKKIQSEQEIQRWFEEGRTYRWMAEEYLRKYDIQASPSMFSQLRRRMGWDGRQASSNELVPWAVRPEHRWANALQMLRAEARRRSGREMSPIMAARLESWKESLGEMDAVVHYEPDSQQGFWYVPREGDEDLVRRPARVTRERRATG